ARVLGGAYQHLLDPSKDVGWEPLPLDPSRFAEADVPARYREVDRHDLLELLRVLATQRLQIYTSLEQIDLDTLRLLGVFQGGTSMLSSGNFEAGSPMGIDLVDLYNVFSS